MTGIWPFQASNAPTTLSHAEGAYLYLQNDKKILDAAGGAVVANIGHGRREVADAIHAATMNATYVVPPWLTPERQGLVEELRYHWLPQHLPCVHLCSGGSEANESAIKIAVQYQAAIGQPHRKLILARNLSYHGTTISMAGCQAMRRNAASSLFSNNTKPYPCDCPLGPHHPDACRVLFAGSGGYIQRLGSENIAALIAEPINAHRVAPSLPRRLLAARAEKFCDDTEFCSLWMSYDDSVAPASPLDRNSQCPTGSIGGG